MDRVVRVLYVLLITAASVQADEGADWAIDSYLETDRYPAAFRGSPWLGYGAGGDVGDAPDYTAPDGVREDRPTLADSTSPPGRPGRWSDFLPIGGQELRDQGTTCPGRSESPSRPYTSSATSRSIRFRSAWTARPSSP